TVLLALRTLVIDDPPDRVANVDLTLNGRIPCGRVSILEIGHEHFRARVERVDDHLPIDGPGDLDPAVKQVWRNRRNPPVSLPDVLRRFQEIGQPAVVEPVLDLRPP